MDNKMLVSIGDRRADFAKELQPLGDRKSMKAAVRIKPLAFHVFHDEIRKTVLGNSSAIEAGDVGMSESSKDPFLALEVTNEVRATEAGFDQLDSYLPVQI